MENEETIIEEVETLQTDVVSETSAIEIYSDITSEPLTSESETETETTTYNDSENLQRIADNTDFGVGFLQAFVVAFVMIMLYKFLKIFF